MTYIPFIYIIKENDFIEMTKFRKEVDLKALIQGEQVTSFYDETYPLFNIYLKNEDNSFTVFQDGQLVSLSQEEIHNKLLQLFSQILNQVASSHCEDLLNDYKNSDGSFARNSVFKDYIQGIEYKSNSSVVITSEDFFLSKYIQLSNEIIFLADCLDSNMKFSHFLKGSVQGFNSFLAYNHIISDFSHGSFSTEQDEKNNLHVYFGDAVRTLHLAQNLCDSSLNSLSKNEKKLRI